MKKAIIIFMVAMLISVAAFANAPKSGGRLVMALNTEPVGLDPTLVTAFASHRVLELVYGGLLRFDEKMNLVPHIASEMEIPNPYTIVFTIREGVRFHDGTLLTVEDVLFTFNRILDPAVQSPAASFYAQVSSVETLGANKVIFILKAPVASVILPNFATGNSSIISKKFVESGANLQLATNGVGPFILKEFVAGNYLHFVKNPHYFEPGLPYLDELRFVIIPEEISRVSALKSGNVDLIQLSEPLNLGQFPESQWMIDRTPVLSYYLLGFNASRPPLDNPDVRNALNYAINREAIIQVVTFGEAMPTGVLNPSLDWAIPPSELPEYTYNPAKAKELLTKAGYPNGFEFSITAAQRFNFDKVAQVIQAQLLEVGVRAHINIVEWGIFIANWRESDFDSFVSMNSGSVEPDIQLNRTFRTGGSTNVFQYGNPKVDELLDLGIETVDQAKRKLVYEELQRILVADSPILFLYSPNNIHVGKLSVNGFLTLPTESTVFLKQTWIDR